MEPIQDRLRKCELLSDEQLTLELAQSCRQERENLIDVLLHLAEFDRRRLSAVKGYPSLFEYCTRVLRYSASAAVRRIAVARAGLQFPSVFTLIRKGELHLSGAAMLAPHLESGTYRRLLRQSLGRSQDEIGRIIAQAFPAVPKRDCIRIASVRRITPPLENRIPADAPSDPVPAEVKAASKPASLLLELQEAPHHEGGHSAPGADHKPRQAGDPGHEPDELYRISFSAAPRTVAMLKRAQELLRHRFPRGEIDGIVQLALTKLLESEDREFSPRPRSRKHRYAKVRTRSSGDISRDVPPSSVRAIPAGSVPSIPSRPIPQNPRRTDPRLKKSRGSRHIPEHVKQTVYERDGGRCSFVGTEGMRCGSRNWLEFDHELPWSLGGSSTNAENIRLLCREHNQLLARLRFGAPFGKPPLIASERNPTNATDP